MKDTIKNLVKAFIGESQARNRYTFYAKIAKKEVFIRLNARNTEIKKQMIIFATN